MDLTTVPKTPSPPSPAEGGIAHLGVDGVTPTMTMSPDSLAAAAADLGRCYEERLAVIPQGGRTQIDVGSVPRRYDVAFSTIRLAGLLEHEPADLTCRVEAGMRLGALQEALGRHGQRLPIDPPHPAEATVGGMLAANTNGLGRGRYGSVRDWVIGITVVYPSGNPARIARAGGKVVKNVAGYDLMKLHIGALGTLGIIAEVNFKVQTIPEASADVVASFDDVHTALDCGHKLALGYLLPAAMVVVDHRALQQCGVAASGPWALAARLEGYRDEVTAAGSQVTAAVREFGGCVESLDAAAFWAAARDWAAPPLPAAVLRVMTSLTGVPAAVTALGDEASVMAQPESGIIHVRPQPGTTGRVLARLRQTVAEAGSVVVERAPAEEKPSLDVWGPPPGAFPLMRGLKTELDPRGILNPGRFVGGI